MNKKDLTSEIAKRSMTFYSAGLSKAVATAALDTLAHIAHSHLTDPGDELTLPGIGKLVVVAKAARTARNPGTGAEIAIAAHNVVKFRPAKELKDAAK
jgi:DNA-binding protein HU-beta